MCPKQEWNLFIWVQRVGISIQGCRLFLILWGLRFYFQAVPNLKEFYWGPTLTACLTGVFLSPLSLASGNHYSILYFYENKIFSSHIWIRSWNICLFCTWLNIIFFMFNHVSNDRISFFNRWIIFYCAYIHFVYPLIHWWTLRLVSNFGYCE